MKQINQWNKQYNGTDKTVEPTKCQQVWLAGSMTFSIFILATIRLAEDMYSGSVRVIDLYTGCLINTRRKLLPLKKLGKCLVLHLGCPFRGPVLPVGDVSFHSLIANCE